MGDRVLGWYFSEGGATRKLQPYHEKDIHEVVESFKDLPINKNVKTVLMVRN